MAEELMQEIQRKLLAGMYVATAHFLLRCRERGLDVGEVVQETARGRIIEDYAEDPLGHSCLVSAQCGGYALHVIVGVAYIEIRMITVYRPDPEEWTETADRRR